MVQSQRKAIHLFYSAITVIFKQAGVLMNCSLPADGRHCFYKPPLLSSVCWCHSLTCACLTPLQPLSFMSHPWLIVIHSRLFHPPFNQTYACLIALHIYVCPPICENEKRVAGYFIRARESKPWVPCKCIWCLVWICHQLFTDLSYVLQLQIGYVVLYPDCIVGLRNRLHSSKLIIQPPNPGICNAACVSIQ